MISSLNIINESNTINDIDNDTINNSDNNIIDDIDNDTIIENNSSKKDKYKNKGVVVSPTLV